jgi:hypothetical protein
MMSNTQLRVAGVRISCGGVAASAGLDLELQPEITGVWR